MAAPDILLIHIMKTGGTSLRRMVIEGVGPQAVYPNDEDLAARRNGWYPGPGKLLRHVAAGRADGARLVVGHVPYALADELDPRPVTAVVLRDPTEHVLSTLQHIRTRRGPYNGAPLAEILADEGLVEQRLRDYQTKIFAFDTIDECRKTVNVGLEIDDERFARAVDRLEQVDVVGVLDDLSGFTQRFEDVTGLPVGTERRDNRRRGALPELDAATAARLEELTRRDRVLYEHAVVLGARRRGGLRRILSARADARGRGRRAQQRPGVRSV